MMVNTISRRTHIHGIKKLTCSILKVQPVLDSQLEKMPKIEFTMTCLNLKMLWLLSSTGTSNTQNLQTMISMSLVKATLVSTYHTFLGKSIKIISWQRSTVPILHYHSKDLLLVMELPIGKLISHNHTQKLSIISTSSQEACSIPTIITHVTNISMT